MTVTFTIIEDNPADTWGIGPYKRRTYTNTYRYSGVPAGMAWTVGVSFSAPNEPQGDMTVRAVFTGSPGDVTANATVTIVPPVPVFPNWYVLAAAVVAAGGLGFLIWRRLLKRA